MRRAYVALVGAAALLATACPRTLVGARDAGSDASSATADAATYAGDAPAEAAAASDAGAAGAVRESLPIPGWVHPAREVRFAEEPHTSREEFLRAHGIASSKPDASCWTHGTDDCSCDRAIAIETADGPKDALVCNRTVELSRSGVLFPFVGRSVLYVADKGAMKIVLDVPTRGTVESEDSRGETVGNVELRAVPSPGGVTFVDIWENDAGPWCAQAVARAAAQPGQEWLPLRRWYAAVCGTAGRYLLKNGRLVKGG